MTIHSDKLNKSLQDKFGNIDKIGIAFTGYVDKYIRGMDKIMDKISKYWDPGQKQRERRFKW